MYCTKCGKEIEKGKVCPECKANKHGVKKTVVSERWKVIKPVLLKVLLYIIAVVFSIYTVLFMAHWSGLFHNQCEGYNNFICGITSKYWLLSDVKFNGYDYCYWTYRDSLANFKILIVIVLLAVTVAIAIKNILNGKKGKFSKKMFVVLLILAIITASYTVYFVTNVLDILWSEATVYSDAYYNSAEYKAQKAKEEKEELERQKKYEEEKKKAEEEYKRSLVDIELQSKLPVVLHDFDYGDEIEVSVEVTDFEYEVTSYTTTEEKTVNLYFSGKKLYDEDGDKTSSACRISWKLYDEDGYVVDSDTCYSSDVALGEKFKRSRDIITDLMPGKYYLELTKTK